MPDPTHADPSPPDGAEPIPPGQRFFDNIFLLLGLALLVMFTLYTGWGLWEILTLPPATLP